MVQVSHHAILQFAWRLYRKNFQKLFTIAFIGVALSSVLFLWIPPELTQEPESFNIDWSTVGLLFLMQLAMTSTNGIHHLIFSFHQQAQAKSLPYDVFARRIAQRIGALLVASIFVNALLVLGVLLYVFPAILVMALTITYLPIVLFEQKTASIAIVQSVKWSLGSFFQAFTLALLLAVLFAFPAFILTFGLSGWLAQILPSQSAEAVIKVTGILLSALTLPMANALIFSFYVALKLVHSKEKLAEFLKKLELKP